MARRSLAPLVKATIMLLNVLIKDIKNTNYTIILNHMIHKCNSHQNHHLGHRPRVIISVEGMFLFIPLSHEVR